MAERTDPELPVDLIARASGGDERAFAALVGPYRVRLYTLLRRELRDDHDAEDVLQEVLYRAWRGLPGYVDDGRFGAWLFAIAYHAIASRRRASASRRVAAMRARDRDGPSPPTPEHELAAAELRAALEAAIAALPERQRHVFLLRQTSEMTFAEIARATRQPIGTVLSHMRYALDKLRRAANHHV